MWTNLSHSNPNRIFTLQLLWDRCFINLKRPICLSDKYQQCRMIFISIRLGNFWRILSCHSGHAVIWALSLACHILNTSSNILDRKIFMWQTSQVFLSSLSFDYSTLPSWHAKEINYHPPPHLMIVKSFLFLDPTNVLSSIYCIIKSNPSIWSSFIFWGKLMNSQRCRLVIMFSSH